MYRVARNPAAGARGPAGAAGVGRGGGRRTIMDAEDFEYTWLTVLCLHLYRYFCDGVSGPGIIPNMFPTLQQIRSTNNQTKARIVTTMDENQTIAHPQINFIDM